MVFMPMGTRGPYLLKGPPSRDPYYRLDYMLHRTGTYIDIDL
jgi:hypothetical protein